MSYEGCAYAVLLSGVWYCDYLSITGRRRPCPPGEGCTVRKRADLTKKGLVFMRQRQWDTQKARALYDQKRSAAAIAEAVGTTASAVAFWRRGLGLPPAGAKTTRESGAPSGTQELSLPEEQPPLGPVMLSVEVEGCALAIQAPDMERAAWMYDYAGKMLKTAFAAARLAKEAADGQRS